MRKTNSKTENPKNNDLSQGIPITNFFVFVEQGLNSEWKLYHSLSEALENVCYNELYVAQKIDEETVKSLIYKNKKNF